jgi:hypothetical protein
MNHHDEELPPFDDPLLEREWRAQEEALRRERLDLPVAGENGRDRQYQRLARILREPAPEQLAPDFARRVAARAAALSPGRLEFALMIALLLALLVVAGLTAFAHADRWAAALGALAPVADSRAGDWLLALCGCLGASALIDRWTQRRWPSAR